MSKFFVWVESTRGIHYTPFDSVEAALDILGLWFQVQFNSEVHTFGMIEGSDDAPHPSDDIDELGRNWREVLINGKTIDEILEDKYALSTK